LCSVDLRSLACAVLPAVAAPNERTDPRVEGAADFFRREVSVGKTAGGLAQLKVRGLEKVRAVFVFTMAACDIVRLPKLLAPTEQVCPKREKRGKNDPRPTSTPHVESIPDEKFRPDPSLAETH